MENVRTPGHHKMTKPTNYKYRRKKGTENHLNKLIEQNFPSLSKEMPIKLQ